MEGFEWGGQNILDWVQSEYLMLVYKGVPVNFLEGSEDVRWYGLEAAREAGEAPLEAPAL